MAKYNYDCEAFGKAYFKRDPECEKCDEQKRCEVETKERLKRARNKHKEDEKGGKSKKVKQTLATATIGSHKSYKDKSNIAKDTEVKTGKKKDKFKLEDKPKTKPKKKERFSFSDEDKSSKKSKKKKKFKLT